MFDEKIKLSAVVDFRGHFRRGIAEKFGEAAKTSASNPTAFHLRAMNMLYEGLKKNNAPIIIVPSSAVESMQLGGVAGMTALIQTLAQPRPAAAPGPWSATPENT